jgi:hypothetical protein
VVFFFRQLARPHVFTDFFLAAGHLQKKSHAGPVAFLSESFFSEAEAALRARGCRASCGGEPL